MKLTGRLRRGLMSREVALYAVFGVLTSLENILLFQLLMALSWGYQAANLVTLVIVKLTAYVCNKNFVFRSRTRNLRELAAEFGRFLAARGATMLIDYFGLIFMAELLGLPVLPGKCFLTVLVIVLNYILGKKHVFKQAA